MAETSEMKLDATTESDERNTQRGKYMTFKSGNEFLDLKLSM